MSKKDDKNEGTLKTGAGRRSRTGRAGRGPAMPRVMVVAALVIIAGGAALFWPRGGTVPTGIGENQTIVSSDNIPIGPESSPRSGDVDINTEAPPELKPESAKEDQAAEIPTKTEVAPPPAAQLQQSTTKPESAPAKTTSTKTDRKPAGTPSQPKIMPQPNGPYAVQAGAFGKAENADTEAGRLKALGWDTRVLANNNSAGEMVFRVRIGFFASRQEAQTFINQNSRQLPGAIAVHR